MTVMAEEFVDVLVRDDEWVRREFDELVAAGWGDDVPPPPAAPQRSHRPRRPTRTPRPRSHRRLRDLVARRCLAARQRAPPSPGAA